MPPKKQVNKPNYTIYKYTVVQFNDEGEVEKLFECIPDRWFIDESKSHCYWPPSTGTAFSLRAIRCEKPDDSWSVYEVIVISEGHPTFNSGFKIVREKCNQKYNTSSAEEHIEAASYRRKHPVLSMQEGSGSLEHIFSKPGETLKGQTNKKQKARASAAKSDSDDLHSQTSNSGCGESSSMTASTQNLDFGHKERGDSEIDLSLDCVNKITKELSIDSQNAGKNEDVRMNSSNAEVNCTITSATVSTSNQSRSNRSPSNSSRSSDSVSGRSDSSKRRQINSRSISSGSSRSNSSRSSSNSLGRLLKSIKSAKRRSRSPSICESVKSSKRRSRSPSIYESVKSSKRRSRSPTKRQRLNGSRSESSSSIEKKRRASSLKPAIQKVGNLVESKGYVNKANEKRNFSGARRPSNYHSTSRSRSIQSISSGRSRSSGSVSKPNRQRPRSSNNRQETKQKQLRHQLYADIPKNRGQKTNKSSINRKPVSRRPPEGSKNLKENAKNDLKHSKTGTHRSRSTHRQYSSENSRNRSRRFSSAGSTQQSSNDETANYHRQKNLTSSNCCSTRDLMYVVQKLSDTVGKNNQQLKEFDRRLHRMELTVNKIFVLVGDLNGNTGPIIDELANDQGFEIPKLPVMSTNELAVMKRKLKDKEFRDFFIQHEKEFCCPTKKSTDTVTISKYLMRFISLRVRCKLTLKDIVDDGATLFKDFHGVYQFLIDVMKAGYKSCRRTITNDDAHAALRIVWGRSKQYYREEQDRKQR